jgi:hypothetical protein
MNQSILQFPKTLFIRLATDELTTIPEAKVLTNVKSLDFFKSQDQATKNPNF